MTEVPEHLLRRSRERKAAASGGATDAGAPATDAAASSSAVEPASGGAAPATRAGGGGAPAKPAEPSYTGPPQPKSPKPRLPLWALPVVAALPFWAMLYSGAFGERATGEQGPVQEGAGLFAGQSCGGCHGPQGQGGVGPAMDGVLKTFPKFEDHVAWVKNGSAAVKGQPYGATGKIATGGMPAFGESMSAEQINAVVCHERVTLAGENPVPPQCEAGASPDAGEGSTASGGDSGGSDTTDTTAGG